MDTITITNHADIEFVVVVNTDLWNSLSDAHEAVISDVAILAESDIRDRMSSNGRLYPFHCQRSEKALGTLKSIGRQAVNGREY